MKKAFFASIALALMSIAPMAQANGCPGNGQWYEGQCWYPGKDQPNPTSNNTTNNNTNGAIAGAIGTGVGIGHGGNATSNATGGQGGNAVANGGKGGQGGRGGQGGNATGGNASVGNVTSGSSSSSSSAVLSSNKNDNSNSSNVSNTNVIDASTRVRHSAASAAPIMMNGYGPGNCFGDTNPSGSFGASMQTFGWGVAASRSKASNVCAVTMLAGEEAGLRYLQKQDRNVPRPVVIEKRILRCPSGYALGANDMCRRIPASPVVRAQIQTERQVVVCPAGSEWDGEGCWAPNLKRVRR